MKQSDYIIDYDTEDITFKRDGGKEVVFKLQDFSVALTAFRFAYFEKLSSEELRDVIKAINEAQERLK